MKDWKELPQEEKDKINKYIDHKIWLEIHADEEYDSYVNKETVFAWREKQMKRFEI